MESSGASGGRVGERGGGGVWGVAEEGAQVAGARFEEEDRRGLSDRSRAPRTQPDQTPDSTCGLLIEMRRRHPRWGPRKIIDALVLQYRRTRECR